MSQNYTRGVNMSYPKIPLFDIDWTLLKGGESNKIHQDAGSFKSDEGIFHDAC